MNPVLIAQVLEGLLAAAPQVLALYQRATSGEVIPAADVQAVLTQYNLDHATLAALVADPKPPTSGA